MNLDDFIVPTSIGTPADTSSIVSSPYEEIVSSSATTVSAIPIKQQQRLQAEELQISRASAPSARPLRTGGANDEFGYVQRHVRKTSIDERRVCRHERMHGSLADIRSHSRDARKHRRKCRRSATTG